MREETQAGLHKGGKKGTVDQHKETHTVTGHNWNVQQTR